MNGQADSGGKRCPQCGYAIADIQLACPRCQVIPAKYRPRPSQPEDARPSPEAVPGRQPSPAVDSTIGAAAPLSGFGAAIRNPYIQMLPAQLIFVYILIFHPDRWYKHFQFDYHIGSVSLLGYALLCVLYVLTSKNMLHHLISRPYSFRVPRRATKTENRWINLLLRVIALPMLYYLDYLLIVNRF